jgi:hypothetical protein
MKSSLPRKPLIALAELFVDAPVAVANDCGDFAGRIVEDSEPLVAF